MVRLYADRKREKKRCSDISMSIELVKLFERRLKAQLALVALDCPIFIGSLASTVHHTATISITILPYLHIHPITLSTMISPLLFRYNGFISYQRTSVISRYWVKSLEIMKRIKRSGWQGKRVWDKKWI